MEKMIGRLRYNGLFQSKLALRKVKERKVIQILTTNNVNVNVNEMRLVYRFVKNSNEPRSMHTSIPCERIRFKLMPQNSFRDVRIPDGVWQTVPCSRTGNGDSPGAALRAESEPWNVYRNYNISKTVRTLKWNGIKQFKSSFKTVLFQFHFDVWTV